MGVSCHNYSFVGYIKNLCLHLQGIEVNYKGEIDGFPSGKMTVRLLLILWTGDHPAQCEICKSKGAGGKGMSTMQESWYVSLKSKKVILN